MAHTIAAIATALGQGGVGIVRLSGDNAYALGLALTQKKALRPRYAHFSQIYDTEGIVIDEAVVLYFKAPHSFTGEDVVEIQGHGSTVLLNLILARCFELGAKQATAGEFSYRAFLNNKLDLLQAEAISDAISATSEAEARSAIRSLSGAFSEKIHKLNQKLIHTRLYVEAAIDFSDEEDVDFLSDRTIIERLDDIADKLNSSLAAAKQGALLKDGVQAVLAGKPNAGKSSLLNTLAGVKRAIVTNVAGTTRDTLNETLVLKGLTIHLTDTAGLRETNDVVEKIGIDRAKDALSKADLVLFVYDLTDGDDPITLAKELLGNLYTNNLILVGNKADLTTHTTGTKIFHHLNNNITNVYVSCETNAGIDILIDTLCDKVGFYPNDSSVIARTRHIDALKRTLAFVLEAKEQIAVYHAGELAAESLRLAQVALNELTGEFTADDLLGKIFSEFCIGK